MDPVNLLKYFEKIVYIVLILLFAIIVAFSLLELTVLVYTTLFVNSPLLLENHELLDLFGYFLLVLIGVELLATMSAYIDENVIHVEIVMVIAIIAITRGVILMEPGKGESLLMIGTAAIILALCSGYYLLKKGGIRNLEK